MILNIFGPSGSGKTTLIKTLLKSKQLQSFYKSYFSEYKKKTNNRFIFFIIFNSITFLYRGSIEEFLNIYSLIIDDLLNLNEDLHDLLTTIFNPFEKAKFH